MKGRRKNTIEEIPVIEAVDILILGGSLAGVAAALEAKKKGVHVYLVGSRSYLGEDCCGGHDFWPLPEDLKTAGELGGKLFPDGGVSTPMHLKLALEQEMLAAKIPFIFNTYPAGVLRDKDGSICGALVTNRSGIQAIRARCVVDASMEGAFLRLVGQSLDAFKGKVKFRHSTLSLGEGEDKSGEHILSLPEAFVHEGTEEGKGGWVLKPRIYTCEVDCGEGAAVDLVKAQAEIAQRIWTPGEYAHQEILTPLLADEEKLSFNYETEEKNLISLSPSSGWGAYGRFMRHIQPAQEAVSKVFSALAPLSVFEQITCHGSKEIEEGQICFIKDALRPGEKSELTIEQTLVDLPVLGSYDVVVAGGGTGGASAAIGAGRSGAKVAVFELTDILGGVGTSGQIATYWYGNRVGFTSEIDQGVAGLEVDEKYRTAKGAWSTGAKSFWLAQQCHSEKVDMWFRSVCSGTWVSRGKVKGLVVAGPYGFGLVKAKAVIDSSGCADIPASAGAPTVMHGAKDAAIQGTGLSGKLPGREYFNSDHNFSDDTDVVDTTAFFVSSKKKFSDAFDAGQLVGSRERRQIVGEFSLSPADFMFERRFPDTICVSSSNFDTHGFTIHPLFMVKPPHKDRLWVDVPYRCLLPKDLEGVLVTGLGVSAHRDALPVIRMQPDVQNQGYAAGMIAAKSVLYGIGLRDIDIKEIQEALVAIGNLPERVLRDEDNFPVSDEKLQEVIKDHWDDFAGLSLIFAEEERARPFIVDAYRKTHEGDKKLRYAEILGHMGDATGETLLIDVMYRKPWDEGWNYRGMGQFGMSMSRIDSLLVALGRCSDGFAWDVVLHKLETLAERPDFSHFRAMSLVCESLHQKEVHPGVSEKLAELLEIPEMRGHVQTHIDHAIDRLTDNPNENSLRNLALRELYLAKAIYVCGDFEGKGREILEDYSRDLRGVFRRFAREILIEETT